EFDDEFEFHPNRFSMEVRMSYRALLTACLAAVLLAAAAAAFEVGGAVRGVDADGRVLRVFAGGQLRMVRVAADARILDREGKPLSGGLRAPELKDGA